MTRLPSVKSLMALGDRKQAKIIRSLLEIWRDSPNGKLRDTIAEVHKNTEIPGHSGTLGEFAENLDGKLSRVEIILECASAVLGAHGAESVTTPQSDWSSPHAPTYSVSFVNTGDAYGTTLRYAEARGRGRWSVGTWGDAIEQLRRLDRR